MTSIAHVIGVDPGLVDTGVVSLMFDTTGRTLTIEHGKVLGESALEVARWVTAVAGSYQTVFIEKYKPRQNLNADTRMLKLQQELGLVIPRAKFLPNMGIKRTVPKGLMQLLDVWMFSTTTHHQDLRSAARIALLGMLKDDTLNHVLAEMVREHLDFQSWTITHR